MTLDRKNDMEPMRVRERVRQTGPALLVAWALFGVPSRSSTPELGLVGGRASDAAVVNWLRTHAVRFATTEPGSGVADLAPLKQIVGDARVVLLGEATHGTREFLQLHHRILEYLVTEMGFRVVTIEAFWARALPVNDALQGLGTTADALSALDMWIWDTHEVRDMLRWMQLHNETVPDDRKVKFYGVDMQDGWSSIRALKEYLGKVDPDYARRVAEALAPLDAIAGSYEKVRDYGKRAKGEVDAVAASIADLRTRLRDMRQQYVARSSSREWTIAYDHARIVAQAAESWSLPDWPNVGGLRDRFMADNVAAILDQEGPDAKVVVLAHNAHVSKGRWAGELTLGHHLKQRFRSAMVVFGFAFNQGSLQAWDRDGKAVVEHTVSPASGGSISATLAAVGMPLSLVDLRKAPSSGPVWTWVSSPHPERSIGSGINSGDQPVHVTPLEAYDVLIFVDRTTRARPTPTGIRPRSK